MRSSRTKPSARLAEAYLEWCTQHAIPDTDAYTVSRVIDWMTGCMSNSSELSRCLQDWIAGVVADTGVSWESCDTATRFSCAEQFLVEVLPGHPCWGDPVETDLRAATLLVTEIAQVSQPRLWTRQDFLAVADRYPGMRALCADPHVRGRLGDLIEQLVDDEPDTIAQMLVRQRVLDRRGDGSQNHQMVCVTGDDLDAFVEKVNRCLGHHRIRQLITWSTSDELAHLANDVVCGSRFARTHLPVWVLRWQEDTDPRVAGMTHRVFEMAGRRPAQAIWITWEMAVAACRHHLDTNPGAAETPAGSWASAVVRFHRLHQRRGWWRRNHSRGLRLNHCAIRNEARAAVLDASELPHRGRDGETNLLLLGGLVDTRQLPSGALSSLGPVESLVRGAEQTSQLVRVTAPRRVVRKVSTSVPESIVDRVVLVRAILGFSEEHGAAPAPSALEATTGFTVSEVEAAMPWVSSYGDWLDQLVTSGLVPAKTTPGGVSQTEIQGRELFRKVFAGDELGMGFPVPRIAPIPRLRRWSRCHVDCLVLSSRPGMFPVILGEFDGEQHHKPVPHFGEVSTYQRLDRERHRVVRTLRKEGVDAALLSVHCDLIRASGASLSQELILGILQTAYGLGFSWINLRPSGCTDQLRSSVGRRPHRLNGPWDSQGVEVHVTN